MRQRPVSCYFCRVRKLRCSRDSPCTNCVARGVTCELYLSTTSEPIAKGVAGRKPPSKTGKKGGSQERRKKEEDEFNVLQRLRRLEEMVLRRGQEGDELIGRVESTIMDLEEQLEGELPEKRAQGTIEDSERLELQCMDQGAEESIYPDMIAFRMAPIATITRSSIYIYDMSSVEPTKCIRLPEYAEAKIILEKYLKDLSYAHHVIHSPSVRFLLDNLYENLHHQHDLNTSQIALILSILASTTYSWTVLDPSYLFPSVSFAHNQSKLWARAAMDALEYSRRTTLGSLEDMQAMIILSFVICNFEGIAARHRNLFSSAIMMGKDLMLHRIDHPDTAVLKLSSGQAMSEVDKEMGRRIWWYLTASDWMLSRYAGPQEGVYTIHPLHMAVNKPMNLNDEDLHASLYPFKAQPISTPTTMSYYIQRIRLAELSRSFTDAAPLSLSAPSSALTHDQVMAIDAQFDDFIASIPSFFHLNKYPSNASSASTPGSTTSSTHHSQSIIIQRYILNSLMYAHRCKLHMHYLARGAVDSTYADSRSICLHSARMVILSEKMLQRERAEGEGAFVLARLSIAGVFYSVVMALIVLLLDLCYCPGMEGEKNGGRETKIKEVSEAFILLQQVSGESPLVERLVIPLKAFLRKHGVEVEGLNDGGAVESKSQVLPYISTNASAFASNVTSISVPNGNLRVVPEMVGNGPIDVSYGNGDTENDKFSNADTNGPAQFDDILHMFNTGLGTDTMNWDGFFSGLDPQYL